MKLTHAVFWGFLSLGSYNIAFSQVELWGVTTEGGVYDHGCLFKTDENGGNQEIRIYPKPSVGKFPLILGRNTYLEK